MMNTTFDDQLFAMIEAELALGDDAIEASLRSLARRQRRRRAVAAGALVAASAAAIALVSGVLDNNAEVPTHVAESPTSAGVAPTTATSEAPVSTPTVLVPPGAWYGQFARSAPTPKYSFRAVGDDNLDNVVVISELDPSNAVPVAAARTIGAREVRPFAEQLEIDSQAPGFYRFTEADGSSWQIYQDNLANPTGIVEELLAGLDYVDGTFVASAGFEFIDDPTLDVMAWEVYSEDGNGQLRAFENTTWSAEAQPGERVQVHGALGVVTKGRRAVPPLLWRHDSSTVLEYRPGDATNASDMAAAANAWTPVDRAEAEAAAPPLLVVEVPTLPDGTVVGFYLPRAQGSATGAYHLPDGDGIIAHSNLGSPVLEAYLWVRPPHTSFDPPECAQRVAVTSAGGATNPAETVRVVLDTSCVAE